MLSQHFSRNEALRSVKADKLGIDNIPATQEHEDALVLTASKMEIVRDLLGGFPVNVHSWYRCPELNKAVKGRPTSQHCKGEAVDFSCPKFGSVGECWEKLKSSKETLPYDQLIYERKKSGAEWIHISFYGGEDRAPRYMAFKLFPED